MSNQETTPGRTPCILGWEDRKERGVGSRGPEGRRKLTTEMSITDNNTL